MPVFLIQTLDNNTEQPQTCLFHLSSCGNIISRAGLNVPFPVTIYCTKNKCLTSFDTDYIVTSSTSYLGRYGYLRVAYTF